MNFYKKDINAFIESSSNFLNDFSNKLDNFDDILSYEIDDEFLEIYHDDHTVFLLNVHKKKMEIWLMSKFSGTHHFHFNGENWINSDGDEVLIDLLRDQLKDKFNIELEEL